MQPTDSESGYPAPPPGAVSLNIKDRSALYAAYMPFLNTGGLFFPTNRLYHIGDEVLMLLTLPGETKKYPVVGNVAWINPEGAQSNKTQGVGIQFRQDESGSTVKMKIEELLSGNLMSTRPTHTM